MDKDRVEINMGMNKMGVVLGFMKWDVNKMEYVVVEVNLGVCEMIEVLGKIYLRI